MIAPLELQEGKQFERRRPDPSLPEPAWGHNPDEYAAWVLEQQSQLKLESHDDWADAIKLAANDKEKQVQLVKLDAETFYYAETCQNYIALLASVWNEPYSALFNLFWASRKPFLIKNFQGKRAEAKRNLQDGTAEPDSELHNRLMTDYQAVGYQLASLGIIDLEEPLTKPASNGAKTSRLMDEARAKGITVKDVLVHYSVKVRGNKAVCPFHDDHDPSLSFNAEVWKCWGCGAKGNLLTLIDQFEARQHG